MLDDFIGDMSDQGYRQGEKDVEEGYRMAQKGRRKWRRLR